MEWIQPVQDERKGLAALFVFSLKYEFSEHSASSMKTRERVCLVLNQKPHIEVGVHSQRGIEGPLEGLKNLAGEVSPIKPRGPPGGRNRQGEKSARIFPAKVFCLASRERLGRRDGKRRCREGNSLCRKKKRNSDAARSRHNPESTNG